ncbi:hypothetical protein AVEN_36770-1 [Araneus ventricosus]|uniref:Uncharacterized protein n=2 Tax=Araneus ventricosus TaxID=182803 RepID=A0A4Y2SUF9_ARAVE|nr:hypothetical protein AVEN_36770-1 [Araneus ventricosus]
MNIELLDDALDESFEETDSEDYNDNESEVEEFETEVSEDTERWANDGDLKKFLLRATRGQVGSPDDVEGPEGGRSAARQARTSAFLNVPG